MSSEGNEDRPRRPVASSSSTNNQPLAPKIGSQPSSLQMDRRSSSSQARRMDSDKSVGSVGMGANRPSTTRLDPDAPAKLLPAGDSPAQSIYDCVVYLFYCPAHDRIALGNSERSRAVWYPFMALEQGFTYAQAAQNGIAVFLGRRKSDNDQEEAIQVPKCSSQFVHMLHVHLPSSDRSLVRIAAFVQVDASEKYPCCQPTIYLNWVQTCDILQDQVESLWGPEVKLFLNLLIRPEPIWIEEYSRDNALRLLNINQAQLYQSKLLTSCKVSQDTVLALFEDYVEHCFPAMLMSLESLKSYLIKYGYNKKDSRFLWILNAMAYKGRSFVDFEEFLVGIICLEPTTEHAEGRIRMLFRYYDVDHDEALSLDEFIGLMRDLHPKSNDDQLREMVVKAINSYGFRNDRLQFEAFRKAITSNKLRGTNSLCRSAKTIIQQVLSNAKKRAILLSSPFKGSKQVVKREGRGICNACRAQEIDYRTHAVTLDVAGMCQKPLQIKDVTISSDNVMTPMRYSTEVVFSVVSIARSFIDAIRDIINRKDERTGLMAGGQDETQMMAGHIDFLSEQAGELLASEERLIRTNAPAMVIGDIQGNINALMALERSLWPSMPVMTPNLIFLGNYIGPNRRDSWNVEVLCYILALKMMSPNKVFILRGANETREENRSTLLSECTRKYGTEQGKFIWNRLNETLDRLPFAAVIDESILCVHSGIPKASGSLITKFYELHESIPNVQKESPLAYELITNVPSDVEQSASEKNASSSQTQPKPSGRSGEFSIANFNSFLKANNLSQVIRGHESPPAGYLLQFGGRCITISAANSSCCVVAFVDGSSETIRLVKVQAKHSKAMASQDG